MFRWMNQAVAALSISFCVQYSIAPSAANAETPTTQPMETRAERDARMAWWREARFGMFIHWGIYSVPAGEWQGKRIDGIGEWIMNKGKIPIADYAKFADQFNPVKFDADQWVGIAKAAGMKYIVITSKHHDGFAMFKSAASPFNIFDATPFKRDPLKELAVACQKQGIKLGFYYSQGQDWHHRGGGVYGTHWDPAAHAGDADQYINEIAVPQVREILSNYGPVAVLWWDTPAGIDAARAARLNELLKLQPGIITNNRLGGGFKGDTETPEQRIPVTGFGDRDWETCMTINDTWGFKSYDTSFKSPETLLRNLIDIASKGGNYLLNVGPDATGTIPEPEVQRLAEIGKWLKINGEAIYGTSAGPFKNRTFDGRVTRRANASGDTLFFNVFKWPSEGIRIAGLKTSVKSATFLDGGTPAKIRSAEVEGKPVLIIEPPSKLDPIATVVAVQLAGPADVEEVITEVVTTVISPDASGTFSLKAADAVIKGSAAQFEDEKQAIGYWSEIKDTVSWVLNVPREGDYSIEATIACDADNAGSKFSISSGKSPAAIAEVPSTGGWAIFKPLPVGRVHLASGRQAVIVTPVSIPRGGMMNLREIRLRLIN